GLAEFVRRRLARGPLPGTAWGMASLGIVAGGGTAGGRGAAGRCVAGCSVLAGVGSRGARRTASGSAGDRVAHARCTVDIVGFAGGAASRAHARGNGSVIVRPLAGIGTAARRRTASRSAGDCVAHAGCTVDVVGLSGGADSRAHT